AGGEVARLLVDHAAGGDPRAEEAGLEDGQPPQLAEEELGRPLDDDSREGEEREEQPSHHRLALARHLASYSSRLRPSRVSSRWRILSSYSSSTGSWGPAMRRAPSRYRRTSATSAGSPVTAYRQA